MGEALLCFVVSRLTMSLIHFELNLNGVSFGLVVDRIRLRATLAISSSSVVSLAGMRALAKSSSSATVVTLLWTATRGGAAY